MPRSLLKGRCWSVAGNPVESAIVKQRVAKRRDQIARVLHTQSEHANPEAKLAELDRISFQSAELLRISYRLDAFGRRLNSPPEACPALFQPKENLLLFVSHEARLPWAPIARELALGLYPDHEPGRIAPGLKEVLSAETAEAARVALDELGFVVLDASPATAATTQTISELGGQPAPTEQTAQPQATEVTTPPTVQPSTAAPIDPVTAMLGPGAATTPPPSDLNRNELPAGTQPGGGGTRARTGQRAAPGSKLRSYVVRNGTPPDGPPDSAAAEKRSTLAQAGIAKAVALEQSCQRHPEVKPHHHKGYDIESRDNTGTIVRYIEVKSIRGLWDTRGVGVTYPEFEKAQELGDKFWLYVVERADQPEARIHQIQDPARKVDQFMYDDGWSEAAEPTSAAAPD